MILDRNNLFWRTIKIVLPILTLLLSINQIFRLQIFGFLPMLNAYCYLLLALNLPLVFLIWPIKKGDPSTKIGWYDLVLFLSAFIINFYFFTKAETIIFKAWEFDAPMLASILCLILWIIVIEGVRRTNGGFLAVFCLISSLYPLFAHLMPSILRGQNFNLIQTGRLHVFSLASIIGIPTQVVGSLLIGFMLFGIILQSTGGGKFFMDFAMSTFGSFRGGPAKVSVISSALFGSLSGSSISNVVTTGTITIPAMKKSGYKDYYAAAIEACASTGGTIMPPVMGTAAFVMAAVLNVGYADIIKAALIPSLLYFSGLFFQIDAYAIKNELKGIEKNKLPLLKTVMKNGWYFLIGFAVLFYFIFAKNMEARGSYVAGLSLIALSMIRKETRLNLVDLKRIINEFGRLMASLFSILSAVGLIIGGLMISGVALSLSRELISLVSTKFLLLLAGAITSFVMGCGLTSAAVYILLSIVLAPALVRIGIEPMAAHFFILYWGILSFITPPVALATFTAAGIAKADPMKAGYTGMRLGFVSYIIPFVFVYNPALLMEGTTLMIIYSFAIVLIGIYIISISFEGCSPIIGTLSLFNRISFIILGVFMLIPNITFNIIGLVVSITIFLIYNFRNKKLIVNS